MFRPIHGLIPLVLWLTATPLCAQRVCLTADLSGAQEVPPVPTGARGTAFAVVDLAANTLTLSLTFDGLTSAETAAHIHGYSPPGVSSGIVFPLPLGKHKNVVWNYPQADEAAILAGLAYVNVHSMNFGGGEIRGQLVRDDSAFGFTSTLNGAQEVPPVPSNGVGTGYFSVDTAAKVLLYNITFANLTSPEVDAHIHGFAPPGGIAGVKHQLPLGFHKVGMWNYPAGDEAGILGGLTYVNIHSSSFPGGEIRGQINPTCSNPSTYCTGKVNSQGCVPAIASSGSPTISAPDDFFVTAASKINQQLGVFFWGRGNAAAPFQGGTLCLAPPVVRSPPMASGGNPLPLDCSGSFSFHVSHAYMAANSMVPGDLIYGQFWSRDPADPFGTGLSNAIQFAVRP